MTHCCPARTTKIMPMKHLLCTALAFLLLADCLQAADTAPRFPLITKLQKRREAIQSAPGSTDRTAQTARRDRTHQSSLSGGSTNSPDGKKIVDARSDGIVTVEDADSHKELYRFKGHTGAVYSAQFSPDGKTIITTGEDKTIRILDADSGKELQRFTQPAEGIVYAAFSPDGKTVVTGRKNGIAQIWDADLKMELNKFEGHTGKIYHAAFSDDGRKIATNSSDGTTRIWDIESEKELQKFNVSETFHRSQFIPGGKGIIVVAQTDQGAIVGRNYNWDIDSGKELRRTMTGYDGVTRMLEVETEKEVPLENLPAAKENWQSLFDGETMAGWTTPVYGGDGEVDVHEGNIVIGRGEMMTGIRCEKGIPTVNYELRYEARRTGGYDFFAACTFPVKESYCTFINGGWGGGLTGLSSVDGRDASENLTSSYFTYKENTWYRFRIQVTDNKIQVWLTPQDKEGNWEAEQSVVELETKDRTLSTRYEMDRYKPLGFCTWNSEGQLRKIEYRKW